MFLKIIKKRINKIKLCAIFTSICFLVSAVGSNLYAVATSNQENKYEEVFNNSSVVNSIYGKVTSDKDAGSDITVVNIQDLHCHPQVQKNISKIIGQIKDKYNLDSIYMEGGYGDIDLSWIDSIKDEQLKITVAEKLIEEGILTGGEYYKITNKNNVKLKGLDNETLHKDNVKRLAQIIASNKKYKEILNKINFEIDCLAKEYVNERNARFNRTIAKYNDGKISSKTFYRQLLKYVQDINSNPNKFNNLTAIKISDYPDICNFIYMTKSSKDVNVKKAGVQLRQVIAELKNKLPYSVYSKLLKETNNLSDNQKSLKLINALCQKEGINLLQQYSEVAKLISINSDNQNFNPINFVSQERELVLEIRKALSFTNEEYEITFIRDFCKYFEDYLEYKLTEADWQYFKKGFDKFRKLYAKYATVDRVKETEKDFEELNKYYEINDYRNEIFVKNIVETKPSYNVPTKERNAQEILSKSKQVVVAVTGGFHSGTLEQLLAEQNVNVVTITPCVYDGTKEAENRYIEIIKEQSKIESQALAYTLASCATNDKQKKLLLSVASKLSQNDREKLKEVLGKDIDFTDVADYSLSAEDVNEEISLITKVLAPVSEGIISLIMSDGGKFVFLPDTDKVIIEISKELVKAGIFLSKGAIFEIEQLKLNGKDLQGIPAEIYSRMSPAVQKTLVSLELFIDKKSNKDEVLLQDIETVCLDTGAIGYSELYLEDIIKNPQQFKDVIKNAIETNKVIVMRVFRDNVDIDSLDREEQIKIYNSISEMLQKIYKEKTLYDFTSMPENKEFIEYDIHFFITEILKNAFYHGNKGFDKPIFIFMNLNKQNEINNLSVYNVKTDEDEKFFFREIRMRLALLGGQHKGAKLMQQNPYRTFTTDDNFKERFYKVSSAIKSEFDVQSAQWLLKDDSNINYLSIFSLSKYPHIWEEIFFRTVPTFISTIAISMLPFSFVTVPLSIALFALFQKQFIKAHIVSLWLSQNNLSWSKADIIKATLFDIFPSKEFKENFNEFLKQRKSIENIRQKFLPTLTLSVPYLATMLLTPYLPFVALATAVGIILHKSFNLSLKNKLAIYDEENHRYKTATKEELASWINQTDFNNEEQVDILFNKILKVASNILNTDDAVKEIFKRINLSNTNIKSFARFIYNEKIGIPESCLEILVNKLDLKNSQHIKIIEIVSAKMQNMNILPTLLKYDTDILNDERYDNIFISNLNKVLSVDLYLSSVHQTFMQMIKLVNVDTRQGRSVISMFIEFLQERLIGHQNSILKIVKGFIDVTLNSNGTDPTLDSITKLMQEIGKHKDLFDNQLLEKFTAFENNVAFLQEMSERSFYVRKSKERTVKNMTVEEFAERENFNLFKQSPDIYFDSDRYTFSGLLKFMSLKISLLKAKFKSSVFLMTKENLDKEKLSEVIAIFDAYMKLLDENLYILTNFDTLTDFSSQYDNIAEHINSMLDCLHKINNSSNSGFRKAFEKISENIRNNKTTVQEQKQLVNQVGNDFFENITTINTLINRIHQKANYDFMSKMMSAKSINKSVGNNFIVSGRNNKITGYNLSQKDIVPEIKRLLVTLAGNSDFNTSSIYIKDNILLWVAPLGAHSVRILADFNEETKSILMDFREGAIDDGSTIRIKMLKEILQNLGFEIEISNQQYDGRKMPVGIIAKLNKETGLNNNTDFANILYQSFILFNNAASLNNEIKHKSQIKQNIKVAQLAIMDVYSNYYALGLIKDNFVKTIVNSRFFLNRILKKLNLPKIPFKEKGYWTFLKIKDFRVGFIRTLGQNTIDKYINKPLEEAFAKGSIVINNDGILESNEQYNPVNAMADKLNKVLSKPSNDIATDMLAQGAIISQIDENEFNLVACGQIGGYILKTGYVKLVSGKLGDIKGDFLSVKVLVDENGIIRYTESELSGYPSQMKNSNGRILLNGKELETLLKNEGYQIQSPDKLTNIELENYKSKLLKEVSRSNIPVSYATVISRDKNSNSIVATIDGEDKASSVFTAKYASPENVTDASQYKMSLFAGGSYSSHAGIVLREYQKPAMILKDSSVTDKGMVAKFYSPSSDVQLNGRLQTRQITETETKLESNDIVIADTANGKVYLFPYKTFKTFNSILTKLQIHIDNSEYEQIKDLLNSIKNDNQREVIIEYIYHQSADDRQLQKILQQNFESPSINQEPVNKRIVKTKKLKLSPKTYNHKFHTKTLRLGEKDSLDAEKVGAKSANQAKLSLTLEQLKSDTGIENVSMSPGIALAEDMLSDILGEKYTSLYEKLKSIVESNKSVDTKIRETEEIRIKIVKLISEMPDEKIIEYIGEENLSLFKDKKVIVRSSGGNEDSNENSAAGIAESFGNVEQRNISKAVKDTLMSFFSQRAVTYMVNTGIVLKPAVLIQEWITAQKAGIMMSENGSNEGIIQVVNGQGEDIVSGRKTPYTFIIDRNFETKKDGSYTSEKTLSKDMLDKAIKIMKWIEEVEGAPVDIEFLIKDDIIYIVQFRPITTLTKYLDAKEYKPELSSSFTEEEIKILNEDTGTEGYKDVFLSSPSFREDIESAVIENKLIVLHFFTFSIDTERLEGVKLLELYSKVNENVMNKFDSLNRGQFFKFVEEDETDFRYFGYEFYLREMVKNALVHGNKGFLEIPVAIALKFDGNKIENISVYNRILKESFFSSSRMYFMKTNSLTGQKLGNELMLENPFRTYSVKSDFADGKFYKVSSDRTHVDPSTVSPKRIYIAELDRFISIFHSFKDKNKIFAWLDKNAHIWEEIVFRVLPSVISIVLPSSGIIVYLLFQTVFVLLHFVSKIYSGESLKNSFIQTLQLIKPASILSAFYIPALATSFIPATSLISSLFISTPILLITFLSASIFHFKYNTKNLLNPLNIVAGKTVASKKKKDFSKNFDFTEDELRSLNEDTGTQGYVEINIDEKDTGYIKREIANAVAKKRLIVFRMFKSLSSVKSNKVRDLFLEISRNISKLFSVDDNGLSEVFVKMSEVETKYSEYRYGYNFFLSEMLKNAFVHGNRCMPNYPIAVSIELNEDEYVQNIAVYNKNLKEGEYIDNEARMEEAIDIGLSGYGIGTKYMQRSYLRDYNVNPSFDNGRFYKVSSSLYESIDEEKKEDFEDFLEMIAAAHRRGLIDKPSRKTTATKLSIFSSLKDNSVIFNLLDKTAPFWEEVIFRFVPTTAYLALIALPITSFVTVPLSIFIFVLFQRQFINAHIITDWLKTKDSGWLNFSVKDVAKMALLGKFNSDEDKQDFKQYAKTEEALSRKKSLILPTVLLSILYGLSSFLNLIPVTVAAITFHYINNINLAGTLKSVNIEEKLNDTGIDRKFFEDATASGSKVISVYDLLPTIKEFRKHTKYEAVETNKRVDAFHRSYFKETQNFTAKSVGFSLGLTYVDLFENNKADVIEAISERNNLICWQRGYDYFYGNSYIDEPVAVEEYIEKIIKASIKHGKHIFFFVPDNFNEKDTKTKREFDYIRKFIETNPQFAQYFVFVVGAYDCFNIESENKYKDFFTENKIQKTLKRLLSFPELFNEGNIFAKLFSSTPVLSVFSTKNVKKVKNKSVKKKQKNKSSVKESAVVDSDIRQPEGYTEHNLINNFIKLATSRKLSNEALSISNNKIKEVLIEAGISKKVIEGIDFSEGLPDNIVDLLKSQNMQITDTTISSDKTFIENLKSHPVLFAFAIEAFCRAYDIDKDSSFGSLLALIEDRYNKKLYEATCTDLRGYFGEIYAVNTLIAGIIPDKRAGPIIIRPTMPENNNARGFDIYDINKIKVQVKTGGSRIVTHHLEKYYKTETFSEIADGIVAIPVITTKNIKTSAFSKDSRVQGIDITTETITKFAHEFVSALHGISYKRNLAETRNIKLSDLINSLKGFPTEKYVSAEEVITMLTDKSHVIVNKEEDSAQEQSTTLFVSEIPASQKFKKKNFTVNNLIGNDVVVQTNSGIVSVLYFDNKNIFVNEKIRFALQDKDLSLYGISQILRDNEGNIIDVIFEEQTSVSVISSDGKVSGDRKNNVSFSVQEIKALYEQTNAESYVNIYLDDDVDSILKDIDNAAHKNKLIIVHMFRKGVKLSDMTPSQQLEKYRQIYSLISNRFQLSDIFSGLVDDRQLTDYTADFFICEMIKNAFVHGNQGRPELPIAIHIVPSKEGDTVKSMTVFNKELYGELDGGVESIAVAAHLTGDHMSNEIMQHNSLRTFDADTVSSYGTRFYKSSSYLREIINERNAYWEYEYKKFYEQEDYQDLSVGYNDSSVYEISDKIISFVFGLLSVSVDLAEKIAKIFDKNQSEKNVIVDYRLVVFSDVEAILKEFRETQIVDSENEDFCHVPVFVVDDISQTGNEIFENTGIKINGNSIYKIKNKDIIVVGAFNANAVDIAKALNNSSFIKTEVRKILERSGISSDQINLQTVVADVSSEDVVCDENILIVPENLLLSGKVNLNKYLEKTVAIKNAVSQTYAEKTIISLIGIYDFKVFEQMLNDGKARKVISVEQYEYLKSSYGQIQKLFSDLRKEGIEVYIEDNGELKDEYKLAGITGQIADNKIYDYYSNEYGELETVTETISLKELENKIVNSDKLILINIETLKNIFKFERDITGIFDGLNAMLGNIKIKTGLGSLTAKDIYAMTYNMNIDSIPSVEDLSFITADINDEDFVNALAVSDDDEIGIILNSKSLADKNRHIFISALKERVLAKKALCDYGKEYGLKDKKFEILLGKMLVMQLSNNDKITVDIENKVRNANEITAEIMTLSDKAFAGNSVAINSVIELILVFSEEYKTKQILKSSNTDIMKSYKAMLSAA